MDKSGPAAQPLRRLLVCGSGLAARMTLAALSHQAPASLEVTWLDLPGSDALDVAYGGVTTPAAYAFNLAAGLDEPALILGSRTAFSFGTQYVNWGPRQRSWMQAFHAPFPVLEGVIFYHYLLQRGIGDISPYLVSAAAAAAGVFAHPPEDLNHPLARAEYGYQFEAADYAALFERQISPRVTRISGVIADIERDEDYITSVRLADSRVLSADLYIDTGGPAAQLTGLLPDARISRRVHLMTSRTTREPLGPPVRTITAGGYGWSALAPVQGADLRLTVYAKTDEAEALQAHGGAPSLHGELALGYRDTAWSGNCVALGHAAGVLEPVTPAPMLLLQRDIERLMSLLPVSADMSVERREFNRQFRDDYRHADMFNRALFEPVEPSAPAYWREAAKTPRDERLERKIAQFESRGLHVAYDHEPFTLEDWIILNFGMGRRPERYDRIADQASANKVDADLTGLRNQIAYIIKTMPPHATYRQGLATYLTQQGTRVL
jgi:tryptophan halogenase